MRGILGAATASPPAFRAFIAWATDGSSWRRILYLVLALPLSTFYSAVIFSGLSVGLGIAILTLGLPLVLMMGFWRWMARFERWLCGHLLGVPLPSPYRVLNERGWFARLLARTADVATWKDLAYLTAHFPLAIADLIAVLVLLVPPFALILAPFTGEVQNFAVALALLPAGLVLLPISVRALSAFAGIHAVVARALLTTSREVELNARVVDLRTSQARIIAAADAERRRLERDLHDGAQQRLVVVALNLRVAQERLRRGEDALELVSQAGDEAQHAIGELRDLARGIHPAVLTERGLGPALRDVAGRCPLPVSVLDGLEERFPPTVEATAYFVVSEALTNVAKYADARSATVSVALDDDRLVIEIVDDGRGGADPESGSGLRGLADRIAALDGTLDVFSPVGHGTRVRAELAVAERREEERGVVLDERAAAILRLRRRRGLVTHAAVFGVFQIAMIAIWALTGMGDFWPGWTILLWGVVLALHASLAILRQPITDSAVFRATARPPGG
ncbi:sensor domain-containing protein [Solirubrobacter ginsenosidimutans]|uniref:histidine kinase n=1 Tax=Solirubrobacter ginsenosidimutans TaxID=490573 RepID=A0A9X3MZE3_9ACTN|nr:sensor domain-containing protein [Solirubrobacter ginsenosidimutans]MDA0165610.1 sensor domain-containing protein [Solirubrobacter ginsenosidimutans]